MTIIKYILAAVIITLLFFTPLKGALANGWSAEEEPPEALTGVVFSITVEVDDSVDPAVTTVVVLLDDGETVCLSVDTALEMGLVTLETRTEEVFIPDMLMIGEDIQIEPEDIMVEEGEPAFEEPIEGSVQSIEVEVDELTEETSVLVTLLTTVLEEDVTNSYRINIDTAVDLLLGILESQTIEEYVPVEDMIGQEVEIPPEDILPDKECDQLNPVGATLGEYLSDLLGVDPELINTYHDEGMGYGVIAQAGVMAHSLGGDGDMLQTILEAKLSGDYSNIVLPDGTSADNWGQLRKALKAEDNNPKNLGQIISGHAGQTDDDETLTTTTETQDETETHGRPENPGNSGYKVKTNHGHKH
jgi:hypothetical protein